MRKISIVGVEGSGKTVLLSAIGDKYENPDISGVFMSPENARAFGFVKLHMDAIRHGKWPAATTTNSNLDWSLLHKTESGNECICQLSLLDFAGELYRLCFGEHSDDEIREWADEMEMLKNHISQSDLLMVIINLSDIINGSPADARTRETMWLTKSVIDYASRNGNRKEVAIVFSQADIYRAEIDACGGNEAALQKYLPHVANVYENLPVFAVSAINNTVPDSTTGIAVPASEFQSEGLDELMEWIVGKTPGYEALAKEMTDARLAPIRLWGEAQELCREYEVSLSAATPTRYEHAKALADVMQELRTANVRSPKNAQKSAAVSEIEAKAKEYFDFESRAYDIISSVTFRDKRSALEKLENQSGQSGRVAAEYDRLIQEIEVRYADLQKKHRDGLLKTISIIIGILLLLAAAAVIGFQLYQKHMEAAYESNIRQKEADGYNISYQNGRKVATWQPGMRHPRNNNLVATSTPGIWKCEKPGYVWQWGDRIAWKSGLRHPQNNDLISDPAPDQWKCTKPGYAWTGGTNIAWKAGQTSKLYPHWISIERENYWLPEEGYTQQNPDEKGLGKLIWNPGQLSRDGNRKASVKEGVWLYKKQCQRCDSTGKVGKTSSCSTCHGRGRVMRRETCPECSGTKWVIRKHMCSKCNGTGKIPVNPSDYSDYRRYQVDILLHPEGKLCDASGPYGYCVAGYINQKEKCDNCTDGMVNNYRVPCPDCSDGTIRSSETCSLCNGYGYRWE